MDSDRLALDVLCDKAQYRPGDTVRFRVRVGRECLPRTTSATLELVITNLDEVVDRLVAHLPLASGDVQEVSFGWTAPLVRYRGFGVDAALVSGGETITRSHNAFEVAEHWSLSPRYGFLADFGPEESPSESRMRVEAMSRLHLNCVQFYDWMYKHYSFIPPEPDFVDTLGRRVSTRVVRNKIDLCHEYGMVALAYGAIYGAEKEFVDQHPNWVLYNNAGGAHSLAGLFYAMNFGPECGWRRHILRDYGKAMELFDFDGIHVDQYGYPKIAIGCNAGEPRPVNLADMFPGFLNEAAALAKRLAREGGIIFNCVNNWPVEAVANTDQAAIYIEVWPPNETYHDLRDLIVGARRLSGGRKQVILSVYLMPFHPDRERAKGAMTAFRLITAVIYASGGFHLLLGEGGGVLAEGYYPKYGRLSPREVKIVQDYYDFAVRYADLISDPSLVDVSDTHACGVNEEYVLDGAPCHAKGFPDTVWPVIREKPGVKVINLINLRGIADVRWNEVKETEPTPVENLHVTVQVNEPVRGVFLASPDLGDPRPVRLDFGFRRDDRLGDLLEFVVPKLEYWNVIWIKH